MYIISHTVSIEKMIRSLEVIIVFVGIYFYFVDGACDVVEIPNGRWSIRMRGRTIYYSCDENFQMIGHKIVKCQHNKWLHPPPICVAPGCTNITNITDAIIQSSHTGSVVKVTCQNGKVLHGTTTLTCNGTEWNRPEPKCLDPNEIEMCDFENGLCGWRQDQQDDFDWTIHSGPTITGRTGPEFDHTYGPNKTNGHYIYMEASRPRQSGDVARILSPWYPPVKSDVCFHFWYHMMGPSSKNDVGSLKFLLKIYDEDAVHTTPIFTMAGNQGNRWRKGIFSIPSLKNDFQLVLEATRYNSYVSDIAVDDWQFVPCKPKTKSAPKLGELLVATTSETQNTSMNFSTTTEESQHSDYTVATTQDSVYKQNNTISVTRAVSLVTKTAFDNETGPGVHIHNNQSLVANSTGHFNNSYKNDSSANDSNNVLENTTLRHNNTFRQSSSDSNSTAETITTVGSSINGEMVENSTNSSMKAYITVAINLTTGASYNEIDRTPIYTKTESPDSSPEVRTDSAPPDSVYSVDTIINMCVGLIVLCLFIVITVIMGCVCRRQQKRQNKKYEEMKLFVETHYRARYITV